MGGAVFAVLAGVRELVAPASFQFLSCGELSRNPPTLVAAPSPGGATLNIDSNKSRHTPCNCTNASRSSHEWGQQHYPKVCAAAMDKHLKNSTLLDEYRGINDTHAFGAKCPRAGHLVAHFRGGDVMNGGFLGRGNVWSSKKAPSSYGQPPVSAYLKCLTHNRGSVTHTQTHAFTCTHLGVIFCESLKVFANV